MTRRVLNGLLLTLVTVVCVTALIQAKDGRWKVDGNGSCVFDPADSGPDQCSPNTGRWKLDGEGGCVFDATDSGPDQCQASGSTDAEVAPREATLDSADQNQPRAGEDQHVTSQR